MQVWPCWSLVHLIANLMKTCTRYVYLLQKRNFWYFGFFSAVTWLQYCRNGVKHETINQFINRFFLVFSLAVGDRTVCAQPQVVGRCRAAFPRYWFNSQTNRCERFTYGGCGGNENNFKTLQECQRRCQWKLCKLFITAIIEYSVYLWYRRLWQFHVLWIDKWAKIFFCEVMKWYFVDQNM